ncbi:MAG: (2Fe-2S)-binding protein [Pseudomonadota bacterium]
MIRFTVNRSEVSVDAPEDMPLLWALRDRLKLTGTKFGCGIAQCGACTVHLDGEAVRSCVLPLSAVAGKSVTTIEGLAGEDDALHPVQEAWLEVQVPQCGYCQSGMIMTAAQLLERNPNPDDAEVTRAMTNICRCGTYTRIRKAIDLAVEIKSRTV